MANTSLQRRVLTPIRSIKAMPDLGPCASASEPGRAGQEFVPKRQFNRWWAQRAHPTVLGFGFFAFPPLCAAE